jgi:hypothetical protein
MSEREVGCVYSRQEFSDEGSAVCDAREVEVWKEEEVWFGGFLLAKRDG